ncbi:MAG: sulfite exporter TauE/SafE family protein [Myxococcales bacterium]|nr:sulfite exporter TauE/SafE family protein [Myxococcales bacterium]
MTALAPLIPPAILAGVINAIAGGGTLLTFPALLAGGLPPVTANATSSVSLVPGSLAAWWGYRGVERDRRTLLALVAPSLVGGGVGAALAMVTGDRLFGHLVPWLVLGATLLFALQQRLAPRGGRTVGLPAVAALQLVIAVYGGFFGAGMGILMLAGQGLLGVADIHVANSRKNVCAAAINGVATLTFVANGRVAWRPALVMAAAAIVGGYLGARLAQRVPRAWVRRAVLAIGFAIAAYMFARQLGLA